MVDNQKEFWRRVLNPPDPSGVHTLVEFDQGGAPPVGALVFPIGTTAQRPSSPVNGMMRYNTSLGDFEFFNGTWQIIPGVAGVSLSNLKDADTDTQIFVENSVGVDDDIIAATIGDNSGNFSVGANVLTFSTAGFMIDAPSATAGITAGVSFAISTGGGNLGGAGGDFTIVGGTGGATGDGGDFLFTAGTGGSTSGAGGSINLTAGSTPFIGAAGAISLTAGDSGSGSVGGAVTINAGDGSSAAGGAVNINAGTVSGTGVGGAIALTAGAGVQFDGGAISLTAGSATEANGGDVTIVGGGGNTGGSVVVSTGFGGITEGTIQLQIDGTEGMTVEVDGTLSVPAVTVSAVAYETLVTEDDDIPNKKFVDDAIAAIPTTPLAFSGAYVGTGGGAGIVVALPFTPGGVMIVTATTGIPPAGVEASALVIPGLGSGGVVGPGNVTPTDATIVGPSLVVPSGSPLETGSVAYRFVAWA